MAFRPRTGVAGLSFLFFALLCVPLLIGATGADEAASSTDQYLKKPLDENEAADESSESPPPALRQAQSNTGELSLSWFLVKIALGLGVVVAGVWGVTRLLKSTGMGGSSDGFMEIRSTLAVGQGQYVQVVQVGRQFFMLGVTGENVRMLGEITDSETIRELHFQEEEQKQRETGQRTGFSSLLERFLGTSQHEFSDDEGVEEFQDLRQKIQDLRRGTGDSSA